MLPGNVSPVQRLVLPVGRVCFAVQTEELGRGTLEVIQPRKLPLQLTLDLGLLTGGKETDRQTERQTGRQADRQGRKTDDH